MVCLEIQKGGADIFLVYFMLLVQEYVRTPDSLQNRVPKVRVLVPLPNDKVLKT